MAIEGHLVSDEPTKENKDKNGLKNDQILDDQLEDMFDYEPEEDDDEETGEVTKFLILHITQ